MNKNQIHQHYLALHDALGTRKDALDKELFDQQHRQVWADCNIELGARKVELEAKPTLASDEAEELNVLEFMFPKPEPPPRNLAIEIDELKAKLKQAGII